MTDSNQDLIPEAHDWWMERIETLESTLAHLKECAQVDLLNNDGVNHWALAKEVVNQVNAVQLPENAIAADEEEALFLPNTTPKGVAARYRHVVFGWQFNHAERGIDPSVVDMADRLAGMVLRSGIRTERIGSLICACNMLLHVSALQDSSLCDSVVRDLRVLQAHINHTETNTLGYIQGLVAFVQEYKKALRLKEANHEEKETPTNYAA